MLRKGFGMSSFNKLITNNIIKSSGYLPMKSFCEFPIPKFRTNINNEDRSTAEKQVFWRIRNIGQLELEFLIMKWYNENSANMSLADLVEFSEEVLEMENPDMNKYFMAFEPPTEKLKYTKKIQDFLLL